jgi:hypothetical protein
VPFRMDRAERVRQILSTRGLTLYRVSLQSARDFGRSSAFYVPHNLYSDLTDPSVSPTIQQMLALSQITNYRLSDWLAAFGFEPDLIPRVQLVIPRKSTTLLDSSVHDTEAWIPWFADKPFEGPVPAICPLGRLLVPAAPKQAKELLDLCKRRFLYGRIGEQDAFAIPHFAAGSIVRADPQCFSKLQPDSRTWETGRFFLVERGYGWTCSQIVPLGKERVLLRSAQNPCLQTELKLGNNARILGIVDAEIRPMGRQRKAPVLSPSVALPKPPLLRTTNPQANLQSLLRSSRLRVGLSFREASSMSRSIAHMLSDELYFAAASTLSDYETMSVPPHHIQKLITLCVLYCISFEQFLLVAGLPLDDGRREPIPAELVPRPLQGRVRSFEVPGLRHNSQEPDGFLSSLLRQWEEVPLFFRHAWNELTALKNFSLSDVFWLGGHATPTHPSLVGATLVVLNRRVKKPAQSISSVFCEQSLYMLLKRDGHYLCGPCFLRDGNLVVPAYPGGSLGTQEFRNNLDAEVIGQVTTIARRLR